MRKVLAPCILILLITSGPLPAVPIDFEAYAQTTKLPGIVLTKYSAGLSQPTHIASAGDGSGRLFVVEQRGRIKIIKNGILQAASFLDMR